MATAEDETALLTRVSDGKTIARLATRHHGRITALDFAHQGKYLLTGSFDGTVRKWNISSQREVLVFVPEY